MRILSYCPAKFMSAIANRDRAGMIAIGEMILMLSLVVTLLCLGTQLFLAADEQSYQLESGQEFCSDHAIYGMGLDRSGKKLWVRQANDELCVLNLTNGMIESCQSVLGIEAYATAQSGDGETSILCCLDNSIILVRAGDDTRCFRQLPKKQSIIESAISFDGGVAVAATADAHFYGWSCQNGAMVEFSYELPGDKNVTQIGVSSSGRFMHVLRTDGTITIHSPETGRIASEVLPFGTAHAALAWTGDEQLLGVLDSNGTIRLLDPFHAKSVWSRKVGHWNSSCFPVALAISPNGRWLAACSASSYEVSVFEIGASQVEHRLKGHRGIIKSLQFSRDSNALYSGGYDGAVREWSAKTWSDSRLVK